MERWMSDGWRGGCGGGVDGVEGVEMVEIMEGWKGGVSRGGGVRWNG